MKVALDSISDNTKWKMGQGSRRNEPISPGLSGPCHSADVPTEDQQGRSQAGGCDREAIETYPTDKPVPSRLILGWSGTRPIHVVAADDAPAQETIIVTVYQPDIQEWESGFKMRKR